MSRYRVEYCRETIDSVASCLDIIRNCNPSMFLGGTYLRGQEDSDWKLLPTIGRKWIWAGKQNNGFDKKQEILLFHRFRRYSYLHFNRSLNEWESLFLARHHGLPVRLLDWTGNPLVALFWACQPTKQATSGSLWMLQRKPEAHKYIDIYLPKYKNPFTVRGIRTIPPLHVSPRISAQGGIFTIQENSRKPLESLDNNNYRDGDCDIEVLYRWKVPDAKKGEILEELEKTGVNIRTLYQDLDGLCVGLWRTEIMRHVPSNSTRRMRGKRRTGQVGRQSRP